MVKALLLVFAPLATWERIVRARRGCAFILTAQLFPLLVLVAVTESYVLIHWGKGRGLGSHHHLFPVGETVVFEAAQILVWFGVVFVAAALVKSLGDTFHGRHAYAATLTVVVYSLSPFFLIRALDAFLPINPWVPWLVAISVTAGVLYNGLPPVMKPDPPHAFGLYLMSAVLLSLLTLLARALGNWYLAGKLPGVESFFISLGQHLPFLN